MNILYLTLHKKWFNMIATGEKRIEYREMKPYWDARLENRRYDEVHFRNGYAKNAPFMRVRCMGIEQGHMFDGKPCYGIHLGDILEFRNYRGLSL